LTAARGQPVGGAHQRLRLRGGPGEPGRRGRATQGGLHLH
jgi:hypothetical protein